MKNQKRVECEFLLDLTRIIEKARLQSYHECEDPFKERAKAIIDQMEEVREERSSLTKDVEYLSETWMELRKPFQEKMLELDNQYIENQKECAKAHKLRQDTNFLDMWKDLLNKHIENLITDLAHNNPDFPSRWLSIILKGHRGDPPDPEFVMKRIIEKYL